MKKETREKLYKISEVAEILGVHEDTLRNWEKEGLIKPERIGTRGDRRYTAEMIGEIKKKGLVSDLAKKAPAQKKDLEEYTKEEMIKELQLLKKQKKYGLVWEDHTEEVVERCKTEALILERVKDKQIKDKDKPTNILIEGDNYHALQVLNYTHKGKVDVIYIDPPYNTGAKNWKYNNDYVDSEDNFRHSKWVSMMYFRLKAARNLLKKDGVLICAIDENELANLSILLNEIFPSFEQHQIVVMHNQKGVQGKNFSYTHEYAVFVIPKNKKIIGDRLLSEEEIYVSNLRNWGNESLRSDAKNCFYPIIVKKDEIVGFGNVAPNNLHPKSSNEVQKNGDIYIWPIDEKGVERKWRYARQSVETIKDILEIKKTSGGVIQIMIAKKYGTYKTVWSDKKYDAGEFGTKILREIVPKTNFPFPKSIFTVYDCLFTVAGNRKEAIILDFFAGSGTTGHAVLKMNKDNGKRKFILVTNNEFGIEEEKEIKNKYKVDNQELKKEIKQDSERARKWAQEFGICSTTTYPRIKNLIKGYTKLNGEKVKGLGGSLEYFKTEFVDIENIDKVSDKKKLEFTYEAGQMIALKENAFKEVVKNKFYQIFTDERDKFVGIYFRENLDKLTEMEKKILDKKDVKLYLFSYGVNDYKKDYAEYKNVTVKDIPEPILKIYKRLNN